MNTERTSRLPRFYEKTPNERLKIISEWANLNKDQEQALKSGINIDHANNMIENVVSTYKLPLGIATNFLINGKEYLIPMAIEEPSVVAAVSNAAKLFRERGGFTTSTDESIMIGQIQVMEIADLKAAAAAINGQKPYLIEKANEVGGTLIKLGGGASDIQVREFPETPAGPMLIIHLLYNTLDAMGANTINTAVEHLAPDIERLTGGRVNLRILSNLSDQRKASAAGVIAAEDLQESRNGPPIQYILEAAALAEVDPYRAATHNKGIMNGIDAVTIATGNDWRAVEAGAHAYAARGGSYTSLTKWWKDDTGDLHGSIELPLAVGTVGGATRVHPTAQAALQILGVQSARELAGVIAAVGLAQNFAAIRALAGEGIQRGHMRMHARQLALAAGATDVTVTEIAQKMIEEGNIRLERAQQLVEEVNQGNNL